MKFGLLKVFLKKFTPFLEEKFDDQHPDEKNDDYETDLNIPNSPSPHLAASNFNCIWKGDFKWEVLQNELDEFKRIKLIFDEIKFPDYSITRMMKVEFIEFEE